MKPCLKTNLIAQAHRAFALLDLLVSMAVLGMLMVMTLQLFNSAQLVTSMGNKRMDADAQARAVFDRMAIDFAQMVKRPDVDYYLKTPDNLQPGNDRLAFYSQVPGYYPAVGSKSPFSLVAYRINADINGAYRNQLQRFGCGLLCDVTSANAPLRVFLPLTISATWPSATSAVTADDDYESIGSQVFRMEYYYVIKGLLPETGESSPSRLSDTPWNECIEDHDSVSGLRDVAAIVVVIAVLDPKSRALVSDTQLETLRDAMSDFLKTMQYGDLEAQWQSAINNPANGIPHEAASAIRVYRRCFYLSMP